MLLSFWFHAKYCWYQFRIYPFLYTDFDNVLLRLPDLYCWLTAGVTGQHGILTAPKHLIPPLVYMYTGFRVCHALIFVIWEGITLFLPFHILALLHSKWPVRISSTVYFLISKVHNINTTEALFLDEWHKMYSKRVSHLMRKRIFLHIHNADSPHHS